MRSADVPTESTGPVPNGAGDAGRAAGAMIAGALLTAVLEVAAGFVLDFFSVRGAANAARGYRLFLAAGGWLWLPLWGASIAGFRAAAWASSTARCTAILAVASLLGAAPLLLRPAVREIPLQRPQTARAKANAILKWSYRSPQTVEKILELSRDPNPRVREQAVLALGVNLIVTDVERASRERPARFADHPLRERLRDRLLEALATDSLESVRAEAARALWKAPRTYGAQPAAAETLAAVLERAARGGTVERLAWLALDAAAGAPHPHLKLAAARFAEATPDSELAAVARAASAGR